MWFGAVFFYINYPLETVVNNIILKPNNKVITSLGKEIYTNNCASCHGKKLEGQPNWRSPTCTMLGISLLHLMINGTGHASCMTATDAHAKLGKQFIKLSEQSYKRLTNFLLISQNTLTVFHNGNATLINLVFVSH